MVHNALFKFGIRQIKLAAVDEELEELAVMHNFIVATHLRVLVGKGVEAMRALRDDLLHAHAIERFDVLRCEHLEDVFVARTSCRIARAHFRWAKNREGNTRALQKLRHCLGDLLVLVIERTCATDPVEVFGFERT